VLVLHVESFQPHRPEIQSTQGSCGEGWCVMGYLLDQDQYHNDEVKPTGKPHAIPERVSDPVHSGSEGIPYGGHLSTALNAVNFIEVDYNAVELRNRQYIRENIARQRAYEAKREEAQLTEVV
jgi:hypothetical protein